MRRTSIAFLALSLVVPGAQSQGTLQYDQQSAILPVGPDLLWTIQHNEPIGQSFTPSLASVGFVQLEPFDSVPNNGVGATLYVNLRSNAINGPILSSTTPVFLPSNFGGVTTFLFSAAATVVPGTSYFFEVVVQSGDTWDVNVSGNYPPGAGYFQGSPQPLNDLWFREGIIVPEPSAAWLVIVGVFSLIYARRRR